MPSRNGIAEALAENAENDRRAGQHDDEDDQPDDGAGTRVLIDDRNRIEIAARLSCHSNLIPENGGSPAAPRLNHILNGWKRSCTEKAPV